MSPQELTIANLENWTLAGARWRAISVTPDRAVVELCTCTGEPVERVQTSESDVIDYVREACTGFGDRGLL